MNILKKYKNNLWNLGNRVLSFILLTKTFDYLVNETPEACINTIRDLQYPRSGLVNVSSRDVKIIKERVNCRFEICLKRYARGMNYNSVKVTGVIVTIGDDLDKTEVNIDIKLGRMFLGLPLALGVLIAITSTDIFRQTLGFPLICFAFGLFHAIRNLLDYQNLSVLIQSKFSEMT